MRLLVFLFVIPVCIGMAGDTPVVETISSGEKIELSEHLVKGRYVLFHFYADWSGPSRKWKPLIERFAKKHPNKVVVKVIEVKSWGMPVAIQHNIKRMPYVRLYSPKGKKVRSGHPREVVNYLKRKAKKGKW